MQRALASDFHFHCILQLAEYLVRLARAMAMNDCNGPPAPGADTSLLAESLLERAERLATAHHDYHHMHAGSLDKHAWETAHTHTSALHPHPHFHSLKLRRERSCHDIPIKEVNSNPPNFPQSKFSFSHFANRHRPCTICSVAFVYSATNCRKKTCN